VSIAEKFYTMEYGAAPEDPKEANQWLERHHRRFNEFIGGAWVPPASAEYTPTADPSTGDTLAEVALGNTADVNSAVSAARKALPAWQALTGHERARYLYALARQVQKHSRRLAVLETMDNGKSIRESRDIDIPLVARHFYHHAGWAQFLESEFPNYQACGVVAQVIPWNFPLLMFAWKVAPALAAGNTVVIKPAMQTPLTALAFAELAACSTCSPAMTKARRHWSSILMSTRSPLPDRQKSVGLFAKSLPKPIKNSRLSSAANPRL
jgi:aldehyde dehydrogenase (NAD+)